MIYFLCRSLTIPNYDTDKVFAVIEALRGSLFCRLKKDGGAEGQGLSVEHSRSSRQGQGKPMTCRKNEKGQSLLEYAMVAAVVAAAVIAMSTYVFRSVQATQQTIQTEFQKE